MIIGGLLAGGVGSRMESTTIPKQFVRVCGVPIFIKTLQTFLSVETIDTVVVSVNVDWSDKYTELMTEFNIDTDRVVLTAGGNTRFESLINIVKAAGEICKDDASVIVTHDCARLFVKKQIILDNIEAIHKYDMVTTSVPVIDTIIQSDDGIRNSLVLERSKLWADQGPQTFYVNKFNKYVSMIPKCDISNYIEAGRLFLSHNCKIGIVRGDRYNFKVTNDIDLKYAEFLIKGGVVQ